jgi:hypothetical protein
VCPWQTPHSNPFTLRFSPPLQHRPTPHWSSVPLEEDTQKNEGAPSPPLSPAERARGVADIQRRLPPRFHGLSAEGARLLREEEEGWRVNKRFAREMFALSPKELNAFPYVEWENPVRTGYQCVGAACLVLRVCIGVCVCVLSSVSVFPFSCLSGVRMNLEPPNFLRHETGSST